MIPLQQIKQQSSAEDQDRGGDEYNLRLKHIFSEMQLIPA